MTTEIAESVTVPGNSKTEWLFITVSKAGYKPLGVVGFAPGTNDGIFLNQAYLESPNRIQYALYNTASNDRATAPRLYVLWIKDI